MRVVVSVRLVGGAHPTGARIALAGVFILIASVSDAAVTSTTQHGTSVDAFDDQISSTDLIQGKKTLDVDVFENPMDSFGMTPLPGWHPANPASSDPADPNGIAAFTDGAGMLASGVTGLLNDNNVINPSGKPAKIVEYPFDSPVDIGGINILTGNNNPDGRIFSTTYIEYSNNGGATFQPLGYFQSDASGTINNVDLPLEVQSRSTLVSIFDDAGPTLLSGVTNVIFNFYSVDNTGGQMRDPYDGVSAITGIDDLLTAAFVSPLVLEIDVLASQLGVPGDYNNNSVVDAADYVAWRESVGQPSLPNRVSGIVGPVGDDDYDAWRSRFGNISGSSSTASVVPEPAAILLWLGAVLSLVGVRFRVATSL